ncbi:hypothetical protein [Tepidibacillus sp. HK-1]|uniref:hypothetical protein n=1 Tax=Tepidibacillus sp. HK-1 TaxID=1883407 RepID=UPI00085360A9|nr:hypothetical protein [Tepidibacillus sp. HK-1]GBF11530.1 hypothetical protein HK1_01562 [Tepidibacillus sp. HK-1]
MNQRNILAYFRSVEDAQKAASELQQYNSIETQVDRIAFYPGDQLNDQVNPITSRFDSLTDLTLGSLVNDNAEVLAAADVSASGMADGNRTAIPPNILLTVVMNEDQAPQVENIIKKYNGMT